MPVFLLDQHQVVRPGEMGTKEEIQRAAAAKGLDCTVIELDGRFRCGGSDAYEKWVVDLLGLEGGTPGPWEPDGKLELRPPRARRSWRTSSSPSARGASARGCRPVTAGSGRPGHPGDDGAATDVVIGDWARPRNVYGDRSVFGAPPAPLWATEPEGFGQVGGVYTAQGFEYDWSGVIIRPDLVWRTDRGS